jgi:hypothetical protein
MATTLERQEEKARQQAPSPSRGPKWVGILAALALAAVTVAAVAVLWPAPQEPSGAPQGTTRSLYTAQELAMKRLAAEGQIPKQAVEGGTWLIKELVNKGLIPWETLEPYRPPVEPLYTAQELTMMRLVAQGQIPKQAIEGGTWLIKELVNKGLIPREAAG